MTNPFKQAKQTATKILSAEEAKAKAFWLQTRAMVLIGTCCLVVGFILAKLF